MCRVRPPGGSPAPLAARSGFQGGAQGAAGGAPRPGKGRAGPGPELGLRRREATAALRPGTSDSHSIDDSAASPQARGRGGALADPGGGGGRQGRTRPGSRLGGTAAPQPPALPVRPAPRDRRGGRGGEWVRTRRGHSPRALLAGAEGAAAPGTASRESPSAARSHPGVPPG